VYHLAPSGIAGFVLANGSISSNHSGMGKFRKAVIEADIVDCVMAMPDEFVYSTEVPECAWPLVRGRHNGRFRHWRQHALFNDANKMGTTADRAHHKLKADDVARISGTCHAWFGTRRAGEGQDLPNFFRGAQLGEIRKHSACSSPTAMSAPKGRKATASRSKNVSSNRSADRFSRLRSYLP